jgi:hypothetical protein
VKSQRLASGRSKGTPVAEDHLQTHLRRRLQYFMEFVIALDLNCIIKFL